MIELMVALVLGLLITLGTTSLFLENKGNYNQNERLARMQENSRYALGLLANDLALTGFWGGVSFGEEITNPGGLSVDSDCGRPGTSWAFVPGQSLDYFHATSLSADPSTEFECVTERDGYAPKLGTNVLSIKHVAGVSTAATDSEEPGGTVDKDEVYVRTVGAGEATLTQYVACSNEVDAALKCTDLAGLRDWEYLVHVYYIGQDDTTGVPSLRRKYLTHDGSTPTIEDQGELAEGVEYFHVQFGLDSNGDGVPDRYHSTPSDTDLQQAVAARIYLLVRSLDRDPTYTDDKTYLLGDVDVNAILNGGQPFHDGFFRRVYSTTVQLRNKQYQLLLQAGAPS